MFLSSRSDCNDFVLLSQADSSRAVADVNSGIVGVNARRARPKDFLRLEKKEVVVVAARGKELSVGAPSNAADLLGVTADPGQ